MCYFLIYNYIFNLATFKIAKSGYGNQEIISPIILNNSLKQYRIIKYFILKYSLYFYDAHPDTQKRRSFYKTPS